MMCDLSNSPLKNLYFAQIKIRQILLLSRHVMYRDFLHGNFNRACLQQELQNVGVFQIWLGGLRILSPFCSQAQKYSQAPHCYITTIWAEVPEISSLAKSTIRQCTDDVSQWLELSKQNFKVTDELLHCALFLYPLSTRLSCQGFRNGAGFLFTFLEYVKVWNGRPRAAVSCGYP